MREGDSYELLARSETHAQLFQRALFPGPGGALVTDDTFAPFTEYVSVVGRGFDTALGEDSLELEVSAWGSVEALEPGALGRYDGDLQTASVRLSPFAARSTWIRFGRQQVAGGAARFARFDGAMASIAVVPALSFSVYGGFTVLPRWDRRPGYYHLGAAADTLLREPALAESPEHAGYWLAGGRASFEHEVVLASASFHEQREANGLARRNLGLDASAELSESVALATALLVELDAVRIANLRVWSDLALVESLDLTAEYLRTEPALLLSRQSVLSVFSTEGYHEAGGSGRWHVDERFSLSAGAWLLAYDQEDIGGRFDTSARFVSRGPYPTVTSLSYVRLEAPESGYHSLRAALSRQLVDPLTGTLQLYAYFYDEPIEGYRTSSVTSGTLEYRFIDELSLLWGGSLARSPYASLDASTLLRLSYQLALPTSRPSW